MSSNPDQLSLLKTPSRKRIRGPGDDLHTLNEAKRRRSSLTCEPIFGPRLASLAKTSIVQADIRDRFLPALTATEPFYNVNKTSPRSARLARHLGLVQPRLLSFHDDTTDPLLNHQLSDPTLPIRTHFSQSLAANTLASSTTYSAAKHGLKKPDRVLDSGPMDNFPLHPCAWSSRNVIAAVIRGRVFTHHIDTNVVYTLVDYGFAECVEWTSDSDLAVGHNWGGIVLINSETRKMRKYLLPVLSTDEICGSRNTSHVNAMSWSKERGVLAVGRANGSVSYFDPRDVRAVRHDPGGATYPAIGVKWSPDGVFLASGHKGGIVSCMDWRANKTFKLRPPHVRAAHRGSAKSLAWAPWKRHLLATGGSTSDHTVRIWSLSGADTVSPGHPVHTLPVSSGISSLHFSPHTTELLSTHGRPVPNPSNSCSTHRSHFRRRSTGSDNALSTAQANLTHHSLLVHKYPSLQRVHTVPDAHAGPIIDSVLAPDGTRVMTFGEDETFRVWTVWGARQLERVDSTIDRYRVR